MTDLVEEALEYAETAELSDSDPDKEFGLPECVVVGCGDRGSALVSRLETEPTTVTIGSEEANEPVSVDHTFDSIDDADLDPTSEPHLERVLESADFVNRYRPFGYSVRC